MQCKVLFCRFPGGSLENPDSVDWFVKALQKAKADARVGDVDCFRISDTPITMGRNRALKVAEAGGYDLVVMLDADMNPDCYHDGNARRLSLDPLALPFWESSFDFWWKNRQDGRPSVIAAPYCGPPPYENVYIFRWNHFQSDHPNFDRKLEMVSREDAAVRAGFEEVAALPTGLILIDVSGLARIPKPYFRYGWNDTEESEKGTTEDVYFTRDLSLAGVPQYVNWSAWAGHWKPKCVGKPSLLPVDAVRKEFREALERNQPSNLRVVEVGERGNNGLLQKLTSKS